MKEERNKEIRQLEATLALISPKVFNKESPLPLAIGIHDEINKAFPKSSLKLIRQTLKRWTKREGYHRAVVANQWRYDLNGEQKGEVSDEHRGFLLGDEKAAAV